MLCLRHEAQPLLSHIYIFIIIIIIIFAPLLLGQYLDYIENVGVKSFVLISIELLFLITFIYVPLHSLGAYNIFVAKRVFCRQQVLSSSLRHSVRTL